MGTLDDAIREHLELKKRSGASEEEVKRLETEAFGPVRRDVQPPAAPAEPADDLGADPHPSVPADAHEDPSGDAAAPVEPLPDEPVDLAPPEPFVPPPPVPPAPPASAEPRPARSWLDDDPDDVPPQQGTSEFTAAEAEAAQGRPPADFVAPDDEGEDLLEETPDFLQETPEHDRLWFEQRPPRDFDFDE